MGGKERKGWQCCGIVVHANADGVALQVGFFIRRTCAAAKLNLALLLSSLLLLASLPPLLQCTPPPGRGGSRNIVAGWRRGVSCGLDAARTAMVFLSPPCIDAATCPNSLISP